MLQSNADLKKERIAAEKQRQQEEHDAEETRWQIQQQNKVTKRMHEKAEKEAELERMLALQREYLEEKTRRLIAEEQGRDCHCNPRYDCRGHPYICLSFFC